MPKGKFPRERYHTDPFIPAIKVMTDNRKEKEFYQVLAQLLQLIVEHITPIVNYAHLHTTYPKYKIPLNHEGEHWDISFLTPDNTLCFIRLRVRPKRRLQKRLKELFK